LDSDGFFQNAMQVETILGLIPRIGDDPMLNIDHYSIKKEIEKILANWDDHVVDVPSLIEAVHLVVNSLAKFVDVDEFRSGIVVFYKLFKRNSSIEIESYTDETISMKYVLQSMLLIISLEMANEKEVQKHFLSVMNQDFHLLNDDARKNIFVVSSFISLHLGKFGYWNLADQLWHSILSYRQSDFANVLVLLLQSNSLRVRREVGFDWEIFMNQLKSDSQNSFHLGHYSIFSSILLSNIDVVKKLEVAKLFMKRILALSESDLKRKHLAQFLQDIVLNSDEETADSLLLEVQTHFSNRQSKNLIESAMRLKSLISSQENDLSDVSPDLYTLAVELRRQRNDQKGHPMTS